MGIYIFNMPVLETLLLKNDDPDFGKHIIPRAIRDWEVFSYIFNGYWHDIGTIRAFWEVNLALTDPVSEFSFYESETTIYTHVLSFAFKYRPLPLGSLSALRRAHCFREAHRASDSWPAFHCGRGDSD